MNNLKKTILVFLIPLLFFDCKKNSNDDENTQNIIIHVKMDVVVLMMWLWWIILKTSWSQKFKKSLEKETRSLFIIDIFGFIVTLKRLKKTLRCRFMELVRCWSLKREMLRRISIIAYKFLIQNTLYIFSILF